MQESGSSASATAQLRVAVCIPTFRRPEGLHALLTALAKQAFPHPAPRLRVVVVDNDALGSARATITALPDDYPWPLDYRVEPHQGIPFARNACLHAAAGEADRIAFIDDDEIPEPDWLATLLRAMDHYDAPVVTGPVVSEYPEEIPSWIRTGGFFDGPRCKTGSTRRVAYTNNVLFRCELLQEIDPWFSEALARGVGEDTHFFGRIRRAGHRIVWVDEAIVRERVPLRRAHPGWLCRRSFRVGEAMAILRPDLHPAWLAPLINAAATAFWLLTGTVQCLAGLVAGRAVALKGACRCGYGAGLFVGLFRLKRRAEVPAREASELGSSAVSSSVSSPDTACVAEGPSEN